MRPVEGVVARLQGLLVSFVELEHGELVLHPRAVALPGIDPAGLRLRQGLDEECQGADVPSVATLQQAAVSVHPQREVLVPAAALYLYVKEDPGVFLGAEGDVRQEVHKSVPVRFAALRPSSEAGQPAQFLIEEDDVLSLVEVPG